MNSPLKAPDHNVPVTGLVALAQTALGLGTGLLLAGKMGRSAKKVTAIAVFSIGAISTLPLVVEWVSNYMNKPGGEREMRKRLASIRRGAGVATDLF